MRFKHMPRIKINSNSRNRRATSTLDATLGNLLRARKRHLDKLKEIDTQVAEILRNNTPTSNGECLQIIRTALASSSIDFNKTYVHYHRPGHIPLVLAQENRVRLTFSEQPGTSSINPSAPPFATVPDSQAITATPLETVNITQTPDSIGITTEVNTFEQRIESPTRNIIDFSRLEPPSSFLEGYLTSFNQYRQ